MLTPRFKLSQDDDFVTLIIHCPFIKAENAEIDISGKSFRFYCQPYFLRLTFPGSLIENGKEKSSYDVASGEVKLLLPKETPGEFFEDLDLLTKLLDVKEAVKEEKVLIKMMDDHPEDDGQEEDENDIFDWHFVQELPSTNIGPAKYGFNQMYEGYGPNITELAAEYLDISSVDTSTPESRRICRLNAEELKFDPDYYMYDYCMNEEINSILEFKPESWKALKRIQKASEDAPVDKYLEFSTLENEQLVKLTNKNYLIDENLKSTIYLGLVDLLFAYSYDYRTSEGDGTVESAWNICKLSGTLSAFDTFYNLEEVLKCVCRRSLSYPLYRSYALFCKVVEDVVILLKLGRRAILKSLLGMKQILSNHEATFVLDRLYITDYCIWIQKASDKRIKSLASELHHFKLSKALAEWDLYQLEQEALIRKEAEESTS